MKKLLTILALAALLCLVCGIALADITYQNVYYSKGGVNQYNFATHADDAANPLPAVGDIMIIGGSKKKIETISPAWSTLTGHNTTHTVTIRYRANYDPDTGIASGDMLSVQVNYVFEPHDYTIPTGVTKNSTCTEKGYDEMKCYGCSLKTNVARNLADHSYVSVKTSSDCTKGGQTQMVCSSCKAVQPGTTTTWGPTAHTFDVTNRKCYVVDVVPACYDGSKGAVKDGKYHLVCAVCGAREDDYKYYDMSAALYRWYIDTPTFDGHQWDEWVEFAADCELPARKIRWCTVCHANQTTITGAVTAEPVFDAANITAATLNCGTALADMTAVCKNCKGTVVNHKIVGAATTTWNGIQFKMELDAATATVKIKRAGTVVVTKELPHVYTFTDATRKKLNAAGTKFEVAPTCTDGAYVSYVCSIEFAGNPNSVNYGVANTHPLAKKLNESKPAKGHTWNPWTEVVAPNAQKNIEGYWTRTCSACGLLEDKHGTETPCSGEAHDWKLKETKPATKDADGSKTYECSICKATKTEVVTYVPDASAKYEVKDVVYDGEAVTGKVSHVDDTKDLAKQYARVTFFYADGTFAVMVVPVEDGEFYAGATTATVHVAVQIVDNAKQITPPATDDIYGNGVATMK